MIGLTFRLITLAVLAIGCGPHMEANVDHFVDCVGDGCNSTYKEKVDEYRGRDGVAGEPGSDSVSTQTTSTVITERAIPGPAGESIQGESGDDGIDGASCELERRELTCYKGKYVKYELWIVCGDTEEFIFDRRRKERCTDED